MQDQLADRIALLAIYIPIIRREIYQFVRMWNVHYIRKQAGRPHSIPGKPFLLYHFPREGIEDYGSKPDPELLNHLLDELSAWGKYSLQLLLFVMTNRNRY
jgi:hypothetical protein